MAVRMLQVLVRPWVGVCVPLALRWLDTVFLGPIRPKFEHKLRRHKQSFGKIATTVVLEEDENLL